MKAGTMALTLVVALVSVTGCKPTEEQRLTSLADVITKQIASRYKDPDAVQFKGLALDYEEQHLCGELNAKNGYGAYTGYEMFRADLSGTGNAVKVVAVETREHALAVMQQSINAGSLKTTAGEELNRIVTEMTCIDPGLLKGLTNHTPTKIPSTK